MNESIDPSRSRSLWLALLGGPVIYSLYFLLGYFWVEAVCQGGLGGFTWLGLDAVDSVVIVLTLVAALLTGAMGVWAYGQWRRQPSGQADDLDSGSFMLLTGGGLSLLFTLVILVTGAPVLVLEACSWI